MMLCASKLLLRSSISRSSRLATKVASLNTSPWAKFEQGPPDPILGLNEAYQKDDSPNKVIVGVGAYRDDTGKPHVLSTVREAEYRLLEAKLDMEYAPITGDAAFVECALRFAYGADNLDIGGRIQGVQALSGTGGLRVMGELLAKHGHTQIAVPNPTWGNHIPIFQNAGLQVTKYRYVDNNKLDPEGMIQDIEALPEGTCVLLHACAHNPTGIDPTLDQWKELSQICQKKNLLPFFDCAYQGFASGDSELDAAAIRLFLEDGHAMAMVQSFSKNFGLYGHRVGALSIVTNSTDEASKVISQLKRVIRPMYSNPPRHGARIVSTILSDPGLTSSFKAECKAMADRIITMRALLRSRLEDTLQSSRPWNHITEQIGMFAYSGLNKEQVTALRDAHHIYCTMDGRISMAGVSSGNVDYIANAIHDVTK